MAEMTFEEIQSRALEMESNESERDTMFKALEDMYLLKADDLPGEEWIKETISPDPRNDLLGAVRLLVAADPQWSVPVTTNNPQTKRKASKIERFCAAAWDAIGKITGRPVHYDAVLSALLYGEVHMTITLTADLVKTAKTPAQTQQAKEIQALTPFLIDVVNPATGFPEWGKFGLRAYLSKTEQTVGEVRDRWGEDALSGKKASDKVTVYDYYDLTYHCVWVEGETDPLFFDKHGLTRIPVVAVITEGSRLFYREQQQTRQPFLYSLWKTGLWNRQNLSLTMMYSLIFAIGSNPIYVWRRAATNKTAPIRDYSTPGGTLILDPNEEYQALAKQVLDPSLLTGLQTAEQKAQESTIYRQTLGAPLGSNSPFSTVSLLSQAGRLPLTSYQRMTSFAVGKAMETGLLMAKQHGGGTFKASGGKGLMDLKADDIPDQFNLEAKLDITLPQDDRQMVTVAAQAVGGDNPLVSLRYAREQWLKIGQSDDMDREIAEERFWNMRSQVQLQNTAQQLQMQAQMQLQQQQGGQPGAVPPNAAMMPAGMQQGMPQMPPDQLQNTGAEMGLPGMQAGAPMEPGMMPGGAGLAGGGDIGQMMDAGMGQGGM